jgi:hypothetical protein
MTPLDVVLQLAICGLLICATGLYYIPGPCKCDKCSFHVNERRMKRERAAEEAHDHAHRGFGPDWKTGPDKQACGDPACARNPNRVE